MTVERAVTFGEGVDLVGIVAEPRECVPERPAVLLWNAGLLHRVGPSRLNVDLGRQLADSGFLVLRFDLSGLGDSEARDDSRSGRERAVSDIMEAMDFLQERYGLKRFVLIGLCSGADNSHHTAVSDERVCGMVGLDGYAYPTVRFTVRRIFSFLASPRRVARYVWRAITRASDRGPELRIDDPITEEQFRWEPPPKQRATEDLTAFVRRGVRLLYVFSGEAFASYNYAKQFDDMYSSIDFKGLAGTEYLPQADHLFSQGPCHEWLVRRIHEWMLTNFPS